MSDESEQQPGEPERPWGERMMDWAKEKVGGETIAAEGPGPSESISSGGGLEPLEDALAPIDFPKDKREFDESPLHTVLGLTLAELRFGYARICLSTSRVTAGGVEGSVHGGLLAAMVDIAMLEALVPLLRTGEKAAGTVDLNITYLRPAHGTQVYAEATVLRKGRTTVVTEVSITDGSGKLCAKGRTIYAVRQEPA
ncbi:MAG: PaaI family thioesterase [Anaerolineaceae bacterium]